MSVRIVCVGSLNQDITVWVSRPPGPDETLAAHRMETFLGGKGANQAVAASRLGAHVAMVGRVGSDIAGGSIVAALETEGVDHRHVEGGEGHTGTAIPIVTDDGQVSIIVVAGANALLRPDDVDRAADVIATADLLLVQGEVSVESSLRAAQLARRAGAQVLVNPAPVLPGVGALLDAATVIVANAQEADALDLVADGQVVITHGAAGAVVGGIHAPPTRSRWWTPPGLAMPTALRSA